MANLYRLQDRNIFLTWVYLSGFLLFIIALGYVFSQAMGSSFPLYFAAIFAILSSIGSYWWSDKIVLSLTRAKEVTPENARELYRLVENLCITAGLPIPRIYVIDDPALNAFATGRDPKHAVVVLTRGLLEKLNKTELEGVIAHELSHIRNRDILLATVVVVLVGFVVMMADWARSWFFWGGNRRDNDNPLGKYLVPIALLLSFLAPLAAVLIQLALSRRREFLADASGALLTRYPEGLASALEKIARDPHELRSANRATAHLFIANPFRGRRISRLFMTHPPVEERIAALRSMSLEEVERQLYGEARKNS